MELTYETPAVIELGDFTQETGWFNDGICPEQIGGATDWSCPPA